MPNVCIINYQSIAPEKYVAAVLSHLKIVDPKKSFRTESHDTETSLGNLCAVQNTIIYKKRTFWFDQRIGEVTQNIPAAYGPATLSINIDSRFISEGLLRSIASSVSAGNSLQ